MNRYRLLVLVPLIGLVAACSLVEPYVYKKDEFDRDSETFFVEPADRESVTVCYSPLATNTSGHLAVAEDACGQYGKIAVYDAAGAGACPVLTPVEAIYRCVAP